ncbi:MAG: zf-TFIIB domain-containing protein [Pseudomonadota bacterium]
MNCPKCKSGDFSEFTSKEGVVVDFCSHCKGIWFDSGEITLYAETGQDVPSKRDSLMSAQATEHACPKCEGQKLVEMPYLPGHDLLVDFCTQCHGIWLDSKELPGLKKLARNVESLGKIVSTVTQVDDMGYQVIEMKEPPAGPPGGK